MSACEYCGEKTGWFQSSHPMCVIKAEHARSVAEKLVFDGTLTGRDYSELSADLQRITTDSNVSFERIRDAVHQGANDAASQIALKAPVASLELKRLVEIIRGFDGSANTELSEEYASQMAQRRWFAMPQLHMSHVLWQVLNQITPDFEETGETVAFNLRSDELPIFQTGNCVTYAEERTLSNRSRTYQGLSIPLGEGIYYHIGGSQGHQERTSGLLPLDGGRILVTTKALYFGGQAKTFRVSLDQVLRYQPYVDGVGVCEDGKSPKVFVFDYRGMDVGWFFYNLLSSLSNGQGDRSTPEEINRDQQANEFATNLQTAFDAFQVATDGFTNVLKSAVLNQGTITTDDLSTYAITVDRLFVAARTLEGQVHFTTTNARQKYQDARQSMEVTWRKFFSVDDGQMSADAYIPFLNEVANFMSTRNECVPQISAN